MVLLLSLFILSPTIRAQEILHFEKVDKLPVGVFDMGYCASEKAVFSVGGQIVQGGEIKYTEVIMIYSPYTDEWSKAVYAASNIEVKGTSTSAYLEASNSIYTLALSRTNEEGEVSYPIEVLNIDNYRVSYDDSNPHRAALAGIAADSSKIYVFGGYGTNEEGEFELNSQLHIYNPATTEWNELRNMPEGRRSKGVIANDHLYLVGGETEDGITAEVLKYNLRENQWTTVGYLPNASNAHAVTSNGEFIFVIGGSEQSDKLLMINTKTNDIDQFDIKFGFEKPGLTVLDDHLYLFGGYNPASNTTTRKTFRISLSELAK